jgi:hypothetical protein
MYRVQIEHECGCFKKSEYESEKVFDRQHEAYNYANIVSELMNEDFCSKHRFFSQKSVDDNFVIRVVANSDAGSCGTDSSSSCGTSCGC